MGVCKPTLLAVVPALFASCALTPQAEELRHPELVAQRRAERERELANPATQYLLACEREVKRAWDGLIRKDRSVRRALFVEPLHATVIISLDGSVMDTQFMTSEPSYSRVLTAYRRVLRQIKFPPIPEELRKQGTRYVRFSVWFQGEVHHL